MRIDTAAVEELVWERLSLIPDPEIPVISITELGVVRRVQWDGNQLRSQFGATACKALYVCETCKEPFEYFKHF